MRSYLLLLAFLTSFFAAQSKFFDLTERDWEGISLAYSIFSYDRWSELWEGYKIFNAELNNPDYTDEYKTKVRWIKRKYVFLGVLREALIIMSGALIRCSMKYGITQWKAWRASKATL